jgi:hypothetical protein
MLTVYASISFQPSDPVAYSMCVIRLEYGALDEKLKDANVSITIAKYLLGWQNQFERDLPLRIRDVFLSLYNNKIC